MKRLMLSLLISGLITTATAQENTDTNHSFEVDTTRIQSNQELPKILYVVPWKDVSSSNKTEQKLSLHDFFGDLYDPLIPSKLDSTVDSDINDSAESN